MQILKRAEAAPDPTGVCFWLEAWGKAAPSQKVFGWGIGEIARCLLFPASCSRDPSCRTMPKFLGNLRGFRKNNGDSGWGSTSWRTKDDVLWLWVDPQRTRRRYGSKEASFATLPCGCRIPAPPPPHSSVGPVPHSFQWSLTKFPFIPMDL